MNDSRPQVAYATTLSPARTGRIYWAQVGLITAYIGVALLVVEEFGHLPLVCAISSSAFLVICVPKATMSRPRNVLGAYITAIAVAGFATPLGEQIDVRELRDGLAALSVGVALTLMAATHTEHVPAAGATLGLTLGGWNLEAAASTLVLVLLLLALHAAFRNRLVNLI